MVLVNKLFSLNLTGFAMIYQKSFGQLLRTKLGDLVAGKAFDKAVTSEIFKDFTNQSLHF